VGPFDNAVERLGLVLPAAPQAVAAYVPWVRTGNLVFVSGQLPSKEGKVMFEGAVGGAGLTVEQGAEAARLCAINALAVLKAACGGDLDQIVKIVRLGVFVQSANGFDGQSKVANGASELFMQVFGEAGQHARAAVGTNALPLNAAVEVELVAEVKAKGKK